MINWNIEKMCFVSIHTLTENLKHLTLLHLLFNLC